MLREGERAFVALGWSSTPLPATYEEADDRLARTAHYWQEWLKHGTLPRPPVAHLPAAQRADAQGPDLRADRAR